MQHVASFRLDWSTIREWRLPSRPQSSTRLTINVEARTQYMSQHALGMLCTTQARVSRQTIPIEGAAFVPDNVQTRVYYHPGDSIWLNSNGTTALSKCISGIYNACIGRGRDMQVPFLKELLCYFQRGCFSPPRVDVGNATCIPNHSTMFMSRSCSRLDVMTNANIFLSMIKSCGTMASNTPIKTSNREVDHKSSTRTGEGLGAAVHGPSGCSMFSNHSKCFSGCHLRQLGSVLHTIPRRIFLPTQSPPNTNHFGIRMIP